MICRWLPGLLTLAALMIPATASAQQLGDFLGSDIPLDVRREDGVAVQDRPHPELAPLGARLGDFLLFPAMTTGLGYTSNVFGSTTHPTSDGFATLAPQAQLVSQWARNFFEVTGSGDIQRYFKESIRSENGYQLQADGRIDLGTGQSNIVGLIHRERGYEDQYSGDFPNDAASPVGYDQTDGLVRGTFQFNRLKLTLNQRINDLVYSNATALIGGQIDESYRNRTEYTSTVRVGYTFLPAVTEFNELSYSRADYHVATPGQPLRSNNSVRTLVGGNFDITPVIRAAIGIGYEDRDYDLSYYKNIQGLAADARVEWLVTELTTIDLQATRKIEDAIYINSPGFFATNAQIQLNHEFLRNVVGFAEGDYEHDVFVGLSRADQQYRFQTGLNYSWSRHIALIPSISYVDRSSGGLQPGQTFKEFRGTFQIRAQW